MCDYSLHGIKNRLAEVGEVLVLHQFSTGSMGLTSPKYLVESKFKGLLRFLEIPGIRLKECAICIPDGASLVLSNINPVTRRVHNLADTESVTFRQLSANDYAYRDAVEFESGLKVRLQDLEIGQVFEVCSLSSEPVDVENVSEVEFATDRR